MGAPVSIPLTQGLFALVDAEDHARLGAFKWCASEHTGHFIAMRRDGAGTQTMHSAIIGRARPGWRIVHLNGDRLDNRRANLAFAPNATARQRARPTGKSGLKGVYPTPDGRFTARIRVAGRLLHLGTFDTAPAAARAYDRAALDVHGPLAALNSPEAAA